MMQGHATCVASPDCTLLGAQLQRIIYVIKREVIAQNMFCRNLMLGAYFLLFSYIAQFTFISHAPPVE